MLKKDYYEVLGLKKNADDREIKKAYRTLAKKYHPDTNQGNEEAELRFKEVTEAYEILSDPKKKKLYDRYGMSAFDGSMGQNGPGADEQGWANFGNHGAYREYHYSTGSMDDIFSEFFGGQFGGFGQRKGKQQTNGFEDDFFRHFSDTEQKGRDLHADITITLEESVFGCDKIIRMDDSLNSSLQVHIPAGIGEGQSIRLKGKGQTGIRGDIAGDLFLQVHIQENSIYERKGQDIYTTVSIPYTTAVLGGTVKVRTLYGNVECRVPAGVQPGSKIRLKNKGVVSMKKSGVYGDEYVIVQIQIPKNPSNEEKQILKNLEKVQNRYHNQCFA